MFRRGIHPDDLTFDESLEIARLAVKMLRDGVQIEAIVDFFGIPEEILYKLIADMLQFF